MFLVLFAMNSFSQTEDLFIYRKYENEVQVMNWDSIYYIDMTGDGIPQVLFTFDPRLWGVEPVTINNWECCCYVPYPVSSLYFAIQDIDTPLNDTTLRWDQRPIAGRNYGSYPIFYDYNVGMRFLDSSNNNYYYGWWRCRITNDVNAQGTMALSPVIQLYETCFCSIPNYPLRIGQNSLDWDVDEQGYDIYFSAFPNPSNGSFNVFGKNIRQANVFNTIGQQVATFKGDGDQLTVDLSNFPAGIYIINVTDQNGKRCVKKVVKQ